MSCTHSLHNSWHSHHKFWTSKQHKPLNLWSIGTATVSKEFFHTLHEVIAAITLLLTTANNAASFIIAPRFNCEVNNNLLISSYKCNLLMREWEITLLLSIVFPCILHACMCIYAYVCMHAFIFQYALHLQIQVPHTQFYKCFLHVCVCVCVCVCLCVCACACIIYICTKVLDKCFSTFWLYHRSTVHITRKLISKNSI